MSRRPIRFPASSPRPLQWAARLSMALAVTLGVALALGGGLAIAQEKNAAAQKTPAAKGKAADGAGAAKKGAAKSKAAKGKASKGGKAAKGKSGKGKAAATTQPSGPDDALVLPYIGDNTFVVGRMDVAKVDPEPLAPFFTALTDMAARQLRARLGPNAQVTTDASASVKQFGEQLKRLSAAGGRYAYLLVDGDLWAPETVFVVPLRKGADVKAMTAVLTEMFEGSGDTVAEVGKALIVTSRPKVVSINARITAAAAGGGNRGKASERPNLPAAFAAAGDAPIRLAVLPGESFRQMVEGGLRALPDTWGGGDPVLLARGMRWMTLAVHQKPAFTFNLTVQAANPENAGKILARATQGIERLKTEPAPDEETKALRLKALESVKPAPQGDTTVTLTLPGEYFQKGVPDVMVAAAYTRFFLVGHEDEAGPTPPPPAPPAPGQTPPAVAGAPADDKQILPYLGPSTVVVGRIDVARFDIDAIEQFAMRVTEQDAKAENAAPADAAKNKAEAAEQFKKARDGVAQLQAAGGHYIYVIVGGGADQPPGGDALVVVPFATGADPAKLTKLISESTEDKTVVQAQLGQAIVSGPPAQIDRIKRQFEAGGGKPVPGAERPDLAEAFAAAGDSPIRFALLPGESARQAIEKAMPQLPPQFGGGDVKVLSRGIKWATFTVAVKPSLGLTMKLRAVDAATATSMMNMVNQAVAQMGPAGAGVASLVKHEGDTITLTVSGAPFEAGLLAARRQASAIAAQQRQGQPAQPAAPEGDGFE